MQGGGQGQQSAGVGVARVAASSGEGGGGGQARVQAAAASSGIGVAGASDAEDAVLAELEARLQRLASSGWSATTGGTAEARRTSGPEPSTAGGDDALLHWCATLDYAAYAAQWAASACTAGTEEATARGTPTPGGGGLATQLVAGRQRGWDGAAAAPPIAAAVACDMQ